MEVTRRRWAKRHDGCCNCTTRRYKHLGRGYCIRCHPLMMRIEAAERWDKSDPTTLKDCQFGDTDSLLFKMRFSEMKANYIGVVKRRLASLKRREEMLKGPIDGMTLEWEFNCIAALTKCKDRNAFTNWAGIFDNQFTPDQRMILYGGLNRIREGIPWKMPWQFVYTPQVLGSRGRSSAE